MKLQDSDLIKSSSLFHPRERQHKIRAEMREWLWIRLGGVRTAMCASLLLLIFFIWFENSSLQVLLFTLLTAWQHRSTLGVLSSTTIAMASAYGIFLLIDLMAESYLLFFLLSVLILLPPENSTLAEARGTPAVLMNYSKIEEMLVSSNSSGGSTEDDLGAQQDNDQAEGGQQEEQEEDETSTALREVWTSKQSSLAISTSSKTTSRKGSMDSSSSFSPGEQFTVTQSLHHSWQDHNLLGGAGVGAGPWAQAAGAESKREPGDDEGEGDGMNVFTRIQPSQFFDAAFLSLPAQSSELRRRRAMQVSQP